MHRFFPLGYFFFFSKFMFHYSVFNIELSSTINSLIINRFFIALHVFQIASFLLVLCSLFYIHLLCKGLGGKKIHILPFVPLPPDITCAPLHFTDAGLFSLLHLTRIKDSARLQFAC